MRGGFEVFAVVFQDLRENFRGTPHKDCEVRVPVIKIRVRICAFVVLSSV